MIYILLEQSPSDVATQERLAGIAERSGALLVACKRHSPTQQLATMHLIDCGALPPISALLRFAASRGVPRDIAVLLNNPTSLSDEWIAQLETHLQPGTDAAVPVSPSRIVLRKHLNALQVGKAPSSLALLPLFPAFAASPGLAYRISLLKALMQVDPFMVRREGVFGSLELALHVRRFNPTWSRVSLSEDFAGKPGAYTVGGWVRWGEVLLEGALEPDHGLYEGAVLRALMEAPGPLAKEALLPRARTHLANDRLMSCRPRVHRGLMRALRALTRRQAVVTSQNGFFLTPAMALL